MRLKIPIDLSSFLKQHEHRIYETRQEREAEARKLTHLKLSLQQKILTQQIPEAA
jgi:hypothetical protein